MAQVDFQSGIALNRDLMPSWAGELLHDWHFLRRAATLDPSGFPVSGLAIEATAAGAAGTGINLTVDRVPTQLEVGDVLDFGGGILRITTRAVVSTAASSIVGTVIGAIASGSTAYVSRGGSAAKEILGGTPISRANNTALWGPANGTHPDAEFYLLGARVPDANQEAFGTLLRHGSQIYAERLPGWADMATPVQTKIRSLYVDLGIPAPKFTV